MKYDDWKLLGNEYKKYCENCEVDLREYYDQPKEIEENNRCSDCLRRDKCSECGIECIFKVFEMDDILIYFGKCDLCQMKENEREKMIRTKKRKCNKCQKWRTLINFKELNGKYGKYWSKLCTDCYHEMNALNHCTWRHF